jgi:hypothetical protein
MNHKRNPVKANSSSNFEDAKPVKSMSIVREFFQFIVENKAWWMVPILLALALIGILVALAPTGATPFIYTLF